MVFSSLTFLFYYLPIVLILYRICPLKLRNGFLLLANLLFYGWGEPIYVLIMVASILIDYTHGYLIDKYRANDALARKFVTSSVVLNLGLLFFFKYWDFFAQYLGLPLHGLPLPLGISFYTFQTMSYSIDVYRGDAPRQKNLIAFGTYVTLFPQLIAGPIVRYRDVALQLGNRQSDYATGATRFTVGLCKKVLLANQLGFLWEQLQSMPNLSTVGAWLGAIAFSLQIYFDFSGYSDMAIGLGKMLGFHFPENFNYPFVARSVTDFWRRWHISLGTWFREYVYIPLGGNRKGMHRWLLNLMIVWSLTGFWHGTSWNFLLWGLYFGVLLILEKTMLSRYLEKLPHALQHVYALFVVIVSMVIFALPTGWLAYLGNMFQFGNLYNAQTGYYLLSYLPLLALAILSATPFGAKYQHKIPQKLHGILCMAGLLLCTAFLVDASYNPFLYFRF